MSKVVDWEALLRQGHKDQFEEWGVNASGEEALIAVGVPRSVPVAYPPKRECLHCDGKGVAGAHEYPHDEWLRDELCPVCLGQRRLSWIRMGDGRWMGCDQLDVRTGAELHAESLRHFRIAVKRRQRMRRDEQIRHDKLSGSSTTNSLAVVYHLTPRRVQQVVKFHDTRNFWPLVGRRQERMMLATDSQLSADAEQLALMAQQIFGMALRWQARFPSSEILSAAVERLIAEALNNDLAAA